MNLVDGDRYDWENAFVNLRGEEGGVPGLMDFFIKSHLNSRIHGSEKWRWSDRAFNMSKDEKERFLARFQIEREEI